MPLLPAPTIRQSVALACLCAAMPVNAQSIVSGETDVARAATISASEDESTSFVLFEHRASDAVRHRQAPARATVTAAAAAAASNAISKQKSAPPKTRASAARERVILHIRAAEARHALPSGLLDAVVAAESNYHPYAVSKAGAAGLAQLMPATARSLGVLDRFDIRANLDGGARYLCAMIDRFGSLSLALAAYNAGPGAVSRAGGIPRNGETPTYVARVLTYWRTGWR